MKKIISAEQIKKNIQAVRKWLPRQGPIDVFILRNNLHGFESLNFHEAVQKVGFERKAHAYMPWIFYKECFDQGRITLDDLKKVLPTDLLSQAQEATSSLEGFSDEKMLLSFILNEDYDETHATISWRLKTKKHSLYQEVDFVSFKKKIAHLFSKKDFDALCGLFVYRLDGVEFCKDYAKKNFWESLMIEDLEEENLLQDLYVAFLWRQIGKKTQNIKLHKNPRLLKKFSFEKKEDIDFITINFLANYFDEGVSQCPFLYKEEEFFQAFIDFFSLGERFVPDFLKTFNHIDWSHYRGQGSLATIQRVLMNLAIPEDLVEHFFHYLVLDLEGWGGILCHYEDRKEKKASLESFIAIRLLLLNEFYLRGSVFTYKREEEDLKKTTISTHYALFEMFLAMKKDGFFVSEIDAVNFESMFRLAEEMPFLKKQIFHEAYENYHYQKFFNTVHTTLQNLKEAKENKQKKEETKASFQSVFCIDGREESLRRLLEESCSSCETYGFAGFFNLDMNFLAHGERKSVALCPVSITPTKTITEKIVREVRSISGMEKNIKSLRKFLYLHSKTTILGMFLHLGTLIFSVVADLVKFLSPRLYRKLFDLFSRVIFYSRSTAIEIDTEDSNSYSYEEMADRIKGLLETIGATKNFSNLFFIIGHGSSSINNPHESAYNCGACSGRRGGPNARVFAYMANEPRVRDILRNRGIDLSDDVYFVGGYHDTCTDDVLFFETDKIPKTHQESFLLAKEYFKQAAKMDAHERTRRFQTLPFLSPEKAVQHVRARSLKYAEPRPEYGHSNNSLCVVGKRELTKGVFLDRRAFLCSYDPSIDESGNILCQLMAALTPVVSGINLQYYFSRVDNEKYGCGTKLSHNVTGLIGVMNGAQSDLRPGLSLQSVEIHEPVRLLVLIHTSPEKMQKVFQSCPNLFSLIEKDWVKLALIDDSSSILEFYKGEYRKVECESVSTYFDSSLAYYKNKRETLDPMMIGAIA